MARPGKGALEMRRHPARSLSRGGADRTPQRGRAEARHVDHGGRASGPDHGAGHPTPGAAARQGGGPRGCGSETWEGRAGLLDGLATLYAPHGKPCRVGLVRPELPGDGPVTEARLQCAAAPCTGEMTAGVGQQIDVVLTPTPEQWAALRPPPEPDKLETAEP